MSGWNLPPGCDLGDLDAAFDADEDEQSYSALVVEARKLDDIEATAGALREAWAALQAVPSYVERYQRDLSHDESETDILRERMAQDNPALASAEDVRLADLYDM